MDTYAATLAARSFRALMAITAKFDLETIQLDAINAFANSKLLVLVYIEYPHGFRVYGYCLQLNQALYGLKESPAIWQQDLIGAMVKLGL